MNARLFRSILAAVVVIGGFYLSFELGRLQAGYSLLDARRQALSFNAELTERNRAIDSLERQISILDTSRDVDRETYDSIEKNLGELQARIQAQEEELAFYRGIVTPGDGVAGLRIQSVEVVPSDGDATHLLRVLLVQAIVHNDRVTGSVRVTLSGMQDGEILEFGLDELGAESRATDIPYAFRYFQTLEIGLRLPQGLEPDMLEVQVWPRSPQGDPIVQSFPWNQVSE